MAKVNFKNVDAYLAAQPDATRAALDRVRSTIQKALPRADETISYNIPAYQLRGRTVIFFAGWKKHYSIYPASDRVIATFRKELRGYEVNDKGTIRFPLEEKVPSALIGAIAKLRAKEVAEELATVAKTSAKQGSSKKR